VSPRSPIDLELLESRTHLDSDVQLAPLHGHACVCTGCGSARRGASASSFAVRINFQPPQSQTVPPGYRADLGREYGRRGNGLTYGWTGLEETPAVARLSAIAPDGRYDSFVLMHDQASWSIAVPDGRYAVNVVAGDPKHTDADYRLEAEGVGLMRGVPRDDYPWIEGAAIVEVSDGKLTIRGMEGARNNRLAFLSITQLPPRTIPTADDLRWEESSITSPLGRVEGHSVRVGNRVHFLGGYNDTYDVVYGRHDILDLETNRWSRGRSLPGAQTHQGVTTDGRFIYVAAGQYGAKESLISTNEVWRYDPVKDRWNRSINLPEPRYGGTLAYWNNALHFIGGTGPDRVTLPKDDHWVLRYDRVERGWQSAAPMLRGGDHLSSITVGDRIYVLGGEHGHGRSYVQHADVQIYDPLRGRWSRGADLPDASSHFESTVVHHRGRIWVFGGQRAAQEYMADVRSYDPARDAWTLHPAMPQARKGGAAWVWQDRFYFAVGEGFKAGTPRSIFSATLVDDDRDT
jgi:N-acetylneuraminic acid mutarotase